MHTTLLRCFPALASICASLFFLGACQDTPTQVPTKTGTLAAASSPASAESLAHQFGPILRGAWVRADYLAVLKRTKSPLLAASLLVESTKELGQISELDIDPAQRAGDSLKTLLLLNNHEGDELTLYFRRGRQAASLATATNPYSAPPGSFTELSYCVSAQDTTLLLTRYRKNGAVGAQVAFERVRGVRIGERAAVQYRVNQLLFEGQYAGADAVNKPLRVQFTADGRVTGLPHATTYAVLDDFAGGDYPIDGTDYLVLDPSSEPQQVLVYQHRADTLRLYTITTSTKTRPRPRDYLGDLPPLMVRGKLRFTLVHQ